MRQKWEEKVEFVECSIPGDGVRKKIIMFNGGNGDLYLTVCPENHRGGTTIRIERSGGAISKNPRLVGALTMAYDAIAGNESRLEVKEVTMKEVIIDEKHLLECTCGYQLLMHEEFSLSERNINFCPSCGKKIINEDRI
jgi:DNA-directed RNA polymerase subunit RPC12/RpoP